MEENSDTTAMQARHGKDIQGIPWDRLLFSRDKYRKTRLEQYSYYHLMNRPRIELLRECKEKRSGANFFAFHYNTRSVNSTFGHFKLRNLVWSTSKHDVYAMSNSLVIHWSSLDKKSKEVLNFSELSPALEVPANPTPIQEDNRHNQMSTLCVYGSLMVAGGFQGDLVTKNLDNQGAVHCKKITHSEKAITNCIEVYETPNGASHLLISNSDRVVRVFDADKFVVLSQSTYPWSVNHTSVSPNKKQLVVVGDHADALLIDQHNGKVITTVKGHLDHSFATAWHPDGHYFATGSRDMSCRVWDVRNLTSACAVLAGRMGPIQSLRFSPDGRFLAMAEQADFVHLFNVGNDYSETQELDIFGEISGISFSPDSEAFFVGVADRTYGSLLEYNRCHFHNYLYSM